MLRAAIVVVALMVGTVAYATGYYETRHSLVGWSEDGQHYAVVVQENEVESLQVRNAEKAVATIDEESVGLEESDTHTAVQRINVRTNPTLRPFKLSPVARAWRNDFRKKYVLRSLRAKRSAKSNCKYQGWNLIRRSDNVVVHHHRGERGCLDKVAGGYLHPNGKFVLVKYTESYWHDDGASNDEYNDTEYALVELE